MRYRIIITASGSRYVLDDDALQVIRIERDGRTREGWQFGGLCHGQEIVIGQSAEISVGDRVYPTRPVVSATQADALPQEDARVVNEAFEAWRSRFVRIKTTTDSWYTFDRLAGKAVQSRHHGRPVFPRLLDGELRGRQLPADGQAFVYVLDGVEYSSLAAQVTSAPTMPRELAMAGHVVQV